VPVDEVRYQLTRYGTSWRGTVPVDEVRYHLTTIYGTSWRGTVPVDEVRYQLTKYGTSWRGTVPVDEVRYQLTRYSTSWRGTVLVDEVRYQLEASQTSCLLKVFMPTYYLRGWNQAEWLSHLTVCQCRNSSGFSPTNLRHSGIWVAAKEALLNNVIKKIQKFPFTHKISSGWFIFVSRLCYLR